MKDYVSVCVPGILASSTVYIQGETMQSLTSIFLSLIMNISIRFGHVRVEEGEYQPINVGVSEDVRVITAQPREQKEPSLLIALAKSFGGTFLVAAVFKFFQDLLGFASPFILK